MTEAFRPFGQRNLPADWAVHLPIVFLEALVGVHVVPHPVVRYPHPDPEAVAMVCAVVLALRVRVADRHLRLISS